MGRYLELAREIANAGPAPRNPTKPETETATDRRLEEAGWKPKESFGGVVVWERPDTGCYVSEEMALHLLNRSDPDNRKRGKRGEVTQH